MPISKVILIAGFAWCAVASATSGQVIRLPAVDLTTSPYPGRQASYPDAMDEIFQSPASPSPPSFLQPQGTTPDIELPAPQDPPGPPGTRSGVFQRVMFDSAWIPRLNTGEGFGMSDMQLRMVLALPFPTRESPLLITPGFGVHYLDGPTAPDMPPRLYDAFCQFRWLVPVTDRLGFDLAFRPGYFSDYEQSSDAAVRYGGHILAAWDWTPRAKVIVGAVYADRKDVQVLPAAGLIWKPYDELSVELLFPRPRIAHQISLPWDYGMGVENWLYLGGEFGGGAWAIRRADQTNDVVNYRDYRVILGTERKVEGGLNTWLEVAYLFGREIEYDSATPAFKPSDSLMLRGGVSY
ncbi:MAG: hypothetical protein U1E05_23730 [Patescibacteria group bacterium]|nr:hypothetical protein [Patescibacteria group bacterium]